ncbi:MAG: DUF2272 domain-containing protein [Caulobacteraceae bacterium]
MRRETAIGAMLTVLATSTAAAPFIPPDPSVRIALSGERWRAVNTACPSLPADASLRQRIVDVAAEEWGRFGYPVEEIRERGLTTVFSPPRGVIVSPSLNRVKPGITRRGMRLGYMEDDRAVMAAIGGYWTAAPDGAGIAIQNELRADYRAAGWAVPWSAAFVSYVMCAAGAGRMDQFARSDSHSTYVDQAIAAADGKAPRAIYRARDVKLGLPKPGDLMCYDRNWPRRYRTVADRRGHAEEVPMHCDIVVRVDRRGGFVASVGGNVSQAVTMTLLNIVPGRKGRPARVQTSDDVEGARPLFTILELTTGGTASLDKAPAVQRLGRKR